MSNKLTAFFFWFPLLSGALFSLSGCVSEGAAFGMGAGSLHEITMAEKNQNTQLPVYGPSQVIYRIDNDRYFTLEEYTRCENGKTFYNNKEKNIHIQISPASGYLFKGRLFWLSTRDDYLAFPMTRDSSMAVCLGSDKGCLNLISVTTDGGKNMRSLPYGSYTQDPTGDTKDYDMLVTNDGFYLIEYRGDSRIYPVVYKWDFDKKSFSGVVESDHEYDLFRPGEEVPVGGFYQIDLSKFHPKNGAVKMQCDRTLEPAIQQSGSK